MLRKPDSCLVLQDVLRSGNLEIAAFSRFKLLRFCECYLWWTWNNLASASTDKMAFCASIGKDIFGAKFTSQIFAAFSI